MEVGTESDPLPLRGAEPRPAERIEIVIAAAIDGSQSAWRVLHQRFASLIISTSHHYGLSTSDVDDVSQTVWLRLVLHLKDIREPRALPGWIVTTTRNESIRALSAGRRAEPVDPMADPRLQQVDHAEPDENLHRVERRQTLYSVLGELRPRHRELFRLLLADPQVSYSEISRRLGIPAGSIGPTRARCLDQLRATNAVRAMSMTAMATEDAA